jgi:hypothetical protein
MRRFWLTMTVLGTLVGCATGEIGSPCYGGPTEDGFCVEGSVCAREPSDAIPHPNPGTDSSFCRPLCDEPSDCAEEGFECRVVAGSMFRACQPRI